jgi:hypothetical protein
MAFKRVNVILQSKSLEKNTESTKKIRNDKKREIDSGKLVQKVANVTPIIDNSFLFERKFTSRPYYRNGDEHIKRNCEFVARKLYRLKIFRKLFLN